MNRIVNADFPTPRQGYIKIIPKNRYDIHYHHRQQLRVYIPSKIVPVLRWVNAASLHMKTTMCSVPWTFLLFYAGIAAGWKKWSRAGCGRLGR
jgi:hypothetical protein